MSDNFILGRINSLDENNKFYIYWNSEEFTNTEYLNKYVSIAGKLDYIQVRTKEHIKRILAIHAREMEIHDF